MVSFDHPNRSTTREGWKPPRERVGSPGGREAARIGTCRATTGALPSHVRQVSWLTALRLPAPSRLAAVASCGETRRSQWRVRAGFAPASLFSPSGHPTKFGFRIYGSTRKSGQQRCGRFPRRPDLSDVRALEAAVRPSSRASSQRRAFVRFRVVILIVIPDESAGAGPLARRPIQISRAAALVAGGELWYDPQRGARPPTVGGKRLDRRDIGDTIRRNRPVSVQEK